MQLSNALIHMVEECGEVCQIVGKLFRFGYNSYHPDDVTKTPNHVLLRREMNDLKKRIAEVEELLNTENEPTKFRISA